MAETLQIPLLEYEQPYTIENYTGQAVVEARQL